MPDETLVNNAQGEEIYAPFSYRLWAFLGLVCISYGLIVIYNWSSMWAAYFLSVMLLCIGYCTVKFILSKDSYYLIITAEGVRRKTPFCSEQCLYFRNISRIMPISLGQPHLLGDLQNRQEMWRYNVEFTGACHVGFEFYSSTEIPKNLFFKRETFADYYWAFFTFGWNAEDLAYYLESLRQTEKGNTKLSSYSPYRGRY